MSFLVTRKYLIKDITILLSTLTLPNPFEYRVNDSPVCCQLLELCASSSAPALRHQDHVRVIHKSLIPPA